MVTSAVRFFFIKNCTHWYETWWSVKKNGINDEYPTNDFYGGNYLCNKWAVWLTCILKAYCGIWVMVDGSEFVKTLRRMGSNLVSQPLYLGLSVNETKFFDHNYLNSKVERYSYGSKLTVKWCIDATIETVGIPKIVKSIITHNSLRVMSFILKVSLQSEVKSMIMPWRHAVDSIINWN